MLGAQGVNLGEMRYVGSWDAFAGYVTQEVVRYLGQTWACISPIAAVTGILGPIPAALLAKIVEAARASAALRFAGPGESKEDVIEITDPIFVKTAVYLGQCKIYEILGNGKAAVVFNPNAIQTAKKSFVHTCIFNSAGVEISFESWGGSKPSIETEVLEAGKKYFVVYFMTNEPEGEGGPIHLPSNVPRTITVNITETKEEVNGNPAPPNDSGHWAKIADAKVEPVALAFVVKENHVLFLKEHETVEVEISATKDALVLLQIVFLENTLGAVNVEINGKKVAISECKLTTKLIDTLTIPVGKGQKLKVEVFGGNVEAIYKSVITLN